MANLLETNVVLSDFGMDILVCGANETFTTTAAAISGAKYVQDIIGAENLGFSREIKEYPILNQGGWNKKAYLNYSTEDIVLNLVRSEQGAYNADSTYHFFKGKLSEFKANNAFFGIVVIRPIVGSNGTDDAYEAEYWTVVCDGLDDSASNDTGREYSVHLARSGAPTKLVVTTDSTKTRGTDADFYKFALPAST